MFEEQVQYLCATFQSGMHYRCPANLIPFVHIATGNERLTDGIDSVLLMADCMSLMHGIAYGGF